MNDDRLSYDAPPEQDPSLDPAPEQPITPPPDPAPVDTPVTHSEAPPAPPPASEPPPANNIRSLPPRPTGPAISSGDFWRMRSDNLLAQLGIDGRLAGRVLIIAVIAAALGAVLDEILGLPGTSLRASFGGTLVAGLSGLSYAYFKGREDAPGLIMAAVAGLVAYLVWYIIREIAGPGTPAEEYIAFSGTAMNIPKAMVSGALAGMLGFGWLALLHRLPDRLLKITRMR